MLSLISKLHNDTLSHCLWRIIEARVPSASLKTWIFKIGFGFILICDWLPALVSPSVKWEHWALFCLENTERWWLSCGGGSPEDPSSYSYLHRKGLPGPRWWIPYTSWRHCVTWRGTWPVYFLICVWILDPINETGKLLVLEPKLWPLYLIVLNFGRFSPFLPKICFLTWCWFWEAVYPKQKLSQSAEGFSQSSL